MKKLMLFTISMTSLFVVGQNPITITSADIPQIGDQMIYVRQAVTNSFVEGSAGANQLYDPIFFVENQIDTMNFISPSSTIYANQYTNSELGTFGTFDSVFRFFSTENDKLLIDGMLVSLPEEISSFLGLGDLLFAKASNPLQEFQFPIEYQSQFTDSAEFIVSSFPFFLEISPDPYTYSDSVRASVFYSRTSNVDGWGDLLTPNGVFPVLRQKIQDIIRISPQFNLILVDTVFGQEITFPLGYQAVPGLEFGDTTFTYIYHSLITTNNPYSVLAEVRKNLQGATTSAKYAVLPSVYLNELEKIIQVSCFPNPSSEIIKIAAEVRINSVKLVATDGHLVFDQKYVQNEIEIDLSNYQTGNYILIVDTEKGKIAKKIVKN